MIEIRKEVMPPTSGKQVPWDSSSLTGRFSFKIEGTVEITPAAAKPGGSAQPPAAPHSRSTPKTLEFSVWNGIQKSSDPAAFEKFLQGFPRRRLCLRRARADRRA